MIGGEKAHQRLRRYEQLKGARGQHWDRQYEDVARHVLPSARRFVSSPSAGADLGDDLFDATGQMALAEFARFFMSLTMPSQYRYQRATTGDDDLDNEYSEYLDHVTATIFSARYDYRANFEAQAHEMLLTWGAFGTAPFFTEERSGGGIRYRANDLSETYIGTDAYGLVNEVTRRFKWRARQAIGRFGKENVTDEIRNSAADQDGEFEFQHCVWPRDDYDPDRLDDKGKPFVSMYINCKSKTVIEEGVYEEFPYQVPRYMTAARESYGRSPAMMVMPDIRMLNEMGYTTIRAAQIAVDPPILLYDDGVMTQFSNTPSALNYGGVDERGNQLAHPFISGAQVGIGLELEEQRRLVIREAFHAREAEVLLSNPNMTATQASIVRQLLSQKAAPAGARLQSEFLGPLTAREFGILQRQGRIRPMPKELADALQASDLSIRYENPLTRLMENEEAIGVLNLIEQSAALESIKPGSRLRLDTDAAFKLLARVSGVGGSLLLDDDALEQARQEEVSQQQMQLAMQAAPGAAGAVRDLAEAQATAGARGAPIGLPS